MSVMDDPLPEDDPSVDHEPVIEASFGGRSSYTSITAPDHVQKHEVLLVDPTGRPLIVRSPRPLGFRPPAR